MRHVPIYTITLSVLSLISCKGGDKKPEEPSPLPPKSSACFDSTSIAPGAIPGFVVPIEAYDEFGYSWGVANAILVDSAWGLIVTNAHLYDQGVDFFIRVNHQSVEAKGRPEWISYETDLAILQVDARAIPNLPSAAQLTAARKTDTVIFSLHYPLISNGLISPTPIRNNFRVIALNSQIIPNLQSSLEIKKLKQRRANGKPIRPQHLYKLYESFIIVQSADTSSFFISGMSGSAAINQRGCVIGMPQGLLVEKTTIEQGIERHLGTQGWMLPSQAIQSLLNKARSSLANQNKS